MTVMIAIKIHQINFTLFQRINLKIRNTNNAIPMNIGGKNELTNTLNKCLLDPKIFKFVDTIKQS